MNIFCISCSAQYKIYNTALICWMVSISVYLGNMAYEANNWAGGMSAIYSLPGRTIAKKTLFSPLIHSHLIEFRR